MSRPAAWSSSRYCCCRELSSGSLISQGLTTWAKHGLQAGINRASQRNLFLNIQHSGTLIRRVRDQADIGEQSLNFRLAESIAIRWHQCGLVQGRTAVPDRSEERRGGGEGGPT